MHTERIILLELRSIKPSFLDQVIFQHDTTLLDMCLHWYLDTYNDWFSSLHKTHNELVCIDSMRPRLEALQTVNLAPFLEVLDERKCIFVEETGD